MTERLKLTINPLLVTEQHTGQDDELTHFCSFCCIISSSGHTDRYCFSRYKIANPMPKRNLRCSHSLQPHISIQDTLTRQQLTSSERGYSASAQSAGHETFSKAGCDCLHEPDNIYHRQDFTERSRWVSSRWSKVREASRRPEAGLELLLQNMRNCETLVKQSG